MDTRARTLARAGCGFGLYAVLVTVGSIPSLAGDTATLVESLSGIVVVISGLVVLVSGPRGSRPS